MNKRFATVTRNMGLKVFRRWEDLKSKIVQLLPKFAVPVSYTHLDVYKRQYVITPSVPGEGEAFKLFDF